MTQASAQVTQADVAALPNMPNGVFPGIPGRKGLPIIGDAIPFFRDTLAFNRRCYAEFGPVFSTRMEEYFANPDQFDPARFGPGREEHKKHAFCWVPFGGGAHKCIGLHFAEMLAKVTLFELLRSSNIESTRELVSTEGGFNYVPFPKPRNDLPLKITRRAERKSR